MQFAEAGQSTSKVIDLSDGFSNGGHDDRAVLSHLWGVRTQIRPVGKIGLGLREYTQHPVEQVCNKEELRTRD